jgi:hypothetical protein
VSVVVALDPLENSGERICAGGRWRFIVIVVIWVGLVHSALHNAAAHNARQCCVGATVACVKARIGLRMRGTWGGVAV